MSRIEDRDGEQAQEGAKSPTPRVVRAEELFHGEQEICIEHDGNRYRLRITRRNKLILQK
ncbi:MAG TPA: hemin uptake protein HemP [Gemmataceae bacterium]|nr:hemin uptake protein HemP [Gemmataceae bacterium]